MDKIDKTYPNLETEANKIKKYIFKGKKSYQKKINLKYLNL